MLPMLSTYSGKSSNEVKAAVEKAQHDLYYPEAQLATRFYVVHASKKMVQAGRKLKRKYEGELQLNTTKRRKPQF